MRLSMMIYTIYFSSPSVTLGTTIQANMAEGVLNASKKHRVFLASAPFVTLGSDLLVMITHVAMVLEKVPLGLFWMGASIFSKNYHFIDGLSCIALGLPVSIGILFIRIIRDLFWIPIRLMDALVRPEAILKYQADFYSAQLFSVWNPTTI